MRRRSRECALQILYQLDVDGSLEQDVSKDLVDAAIEAFWKSFEAAAPADRDFTQRLVCGVVDNLSAVDGVIDGASAHWRVGRMSKVDRNLIRVAAFEIERCPDIPASVSINEALEIAKRFSGGDSVGFINGVLDKLAKAGESHPEVASS